MQMRRDPTQRNASSPRSLDEAPISIIDRSPIAGLADEHWSL